MILHTSPEGGQTIHQQTPFSHLHPKVKSKKLFFFHQEQGKAPSPWDTRTNFAPASSSGEVEWLIANPFSLSLVYTSEELRVTFPILVPSFSLWGINQFFTVFPFVFFSAANILISLYVYMYVP